MTVTPSDHPRSRVSWLMLRLLLGIEVLLLAWLLVFTVVEAVMSAGDPMQKISLVVMTVLVFAWVGLTLVGAAKTRASWVRGSALTIHVLLFAAGTGCLQLAIGPWWLGFALVLLALAGFAAAILARPDTRPADEVGAE